MQNEVTDLVKRYFDAFNAGNASGMLACLSDTVVHDVNQGGRREGKAKFAEFLQHMDRCYKEQLRDIIVMASPDGTRASAEYIVLGKYVASDEGLPAATGQTYVLPAGSFFSIADGRISRVTTYYNLTNWTGQVGG
ncbi:MAG: ketosteroid isomerase-related protein [Micropepsaceae bacterium]